MHHTFINLAHIFSHAHNTPPQYKKASFANSNETSRFYLCKCVKYDDTGFQKKIKSKEKERKKKSLKSVDAVRLTSQDREIKLSALKMEFKLIFAILIFNGVQSQDYCNKSLCKGRNHIACGHSGVSCKNKNLTFF